MHRLILIEEQLLVLKEKRALKICLEGSLLEELREAESRVNKLAYDIHELRNTFSVMELERLELEKQRAEILQNG